jgi:hypothetical protein
MRRHEDHGPLLGSVLFDLTDPAWLPLKSAVRQLAHAEPARSLRHVLAEGQVVLRDGWPARSDMSALAAELEVVQEGIARDLAELRVRYAPLVQALLRLEARSRRWSLEIDRLCLDDGSVH